jgi:hypothetical protein
MPIGNDEPSLVESFAGIVESGPRLRQTYNVAG